MCASAAQGRKLTLRERCCRRCCRVPFGTHTHVFLRGDQWEERARQFLPGVRVGRIRQDVIDVAGKDVVIAMLQSLVARGDEYPTADFGMVIVDECHHICARAFSRALFTICAPRHGDGKRGAGGAGAREAAASDVCMLGLSATPHRKDGLTDCLFWFFGPLAFSASRPAWQMQGVQVHWRSFSSGAGMGRTSFAEEVNTLAACLSRNLLICDEVKRAWGAGRKVLLLSDRREHLQVLKTLICAPASPSPSSASPASGMQPVPSASVGFYVGGVKGADLEVAGRCRIILATYGMCSEGLDIPSLNTLILATPRATVTQSVGRILRGQDACGGDAQDGDDRGTRGEGRQRPVFTPLVVDVVDVETSARLDRLAKARWQEFKSAGFTLTRCAAAVGGDAHVSPDALSDDAHVRSPSPHSSAVGEEEEGEEGVAAVTGKDAQEEEGTRGGGDKKEEATHSRDAFAKLDGVRGGRRRGEGGVGNGCWAVRERLGCDLCQFGAYGGRELRGVPGCDSSECGALEAGEFSDEEVTICRQRSEDEGAASRRGAAQGGQRNVPSRAAPRARAALVGAGRSVASGGSCQVEEDAGDSCMYDTSSPLLDLALLVYSGRGGGGVGGPGGEERRGGIGGGISGKSGAAARERDEESGAMHASCRSTSSQESAAKRRLVAAAPLAAVPTPTGTSTALRKAWLRLPGAQTVRHGEQGVSGGAGGAGGAGDDAGNRVCASCGHAFSSFFAHTCSAP